MDFMDRLADHLKERDVLTSSSRDHMKSVTLASSPPDSETLRKELIALIKFAVWKHYIEYDIARNEVLNWMAKEAEREQRRRLDYLRWK